MYSAWSQRYVFSMESWIVIQHGVRDRYSAWSQEYVFSMESGIGI